ncbi:MAG TPA: YdcH family protein [Terriglobia bacterium]
MSTPAGAIRMQLMASNPEYQKLSQQHAHYAALLDQLSSRRYLSEQEQLEETRIKKMKLRLKDEMETLVHKRGSA